MDQSEVIRRKVSGARVAPVVAPVVGAHKAWPLALARSARDGLALGLNVTSLVARHQSLAELLEAPPDLALIAVLEGPREGLGVIAISPEVLAGLIEVQMLGRVSPTPAPARKPTRTDAAMVVDWIDRALRALEGALLADDDLIWTDGFRYASFLDDPRPLGLLLEDVNYRVLEVELNLAGGAKTGTILLALPTRGQGRRPMREQVVTPDQGEMVAFSAALEAQVMASDCSLQAILHRMTIPLSAIMTLKVGDSVPLSATVLDQIAIEGLDGRPLAQGKLGQHRGMRAVRMSQMAADRGRAATGATVKGRGGQETAAPGEGAGGLPALPTDYLRTGTG